MARTRRAARDVADLRDGGEIWIDHAAVEARDIEWLRDVEWLTLWNVALPHGFLSTLPRLWAIDLRGGSSTDLRAVEGCDGLRCLTVNQVRGLRDLSIVGSLGSLEFLSLYGLKQVEFVPSLKELRALRRLEVGQMRGLQTMAGLLDAPAIEQLCLRKWVNVTADDVARINGHASLREFEWWAEDVPAYRWLPVVEAVGLPKAEPMVPRDWFAERDAKR